MFGSLPQKPPDPKITALRGFAEDLLRKKIAKAGEELRHVHAAYKETEGKLYLAQLEMAEVEERLEALEHILRNRSSFAEDFGAIVGMDSVRKLRAREERVMVETKRIIQLPSGASSLGGGYDVGQFEIHIRIPHPQDPYSTDQIAFQPGKYRGEWRHPHANLQLERTCFGGFAEILLKNIADLRIVTVVHLLLSFLKLDSTAPSQRIESPGVHYTPELDLGYTDKAERERDLASFVALMDLATQRHYTRISSEKKQTAEKTLGEATDKFVKSRQAIKEASLWLDRLDNHLKSVGSKVNQEAEQFNGRWKDVVDGIKFEEGCLEISFSFKSMPLALLIGEGGPPQLKGWPAGKTSPAVDESGNLNLDRGFLEKPALLEKLARLQRAGKASEIFRIVWKLLHNESPGGE